MADENNQESIVSHLNADTDSSAVAIHHTLGPLPFQASPGSHMHDGKDSRKIDYNSLLNLPEIGGGGATDLDDLTDVVIASPVTNEVLQYTASNLWENKTLAEANIATADHNHSGVYSPVGHTHDDRYYTETEITSLLSGKSDTTHTHTGVYAPASHTHDDRYYTETEITSLLSGKSDTGHTHTGVYSPVGHSHVIADVTGLATSLADKADDVHTHAISDVTGLQTSLDAKALAEGYTANRVIVSNGSGAIGVSTAIDTTELGYLNGVTSNIQTQISAKANNSGYTASRVLISDATGNVVVSPLVSTTELDYLDGVTSAIQTQLNGKAALSHTHITSEVTGLDTALAGKASSTHTHAIADVTGLQTALDGKAANSGYTGSRVVVTLSDGSLTTSGTIDTTELGYLNGVTSGIQSQINSKAEAGTNGVPFAMAANRTTTAAGTALAINTQETATTVTFPTSRFSVTPSVTANTSSPRYVAAVTSVSSTGFTFIVRNVSDAAGTTYTWNWMAIQMTSGAVSG